MIRKKIKKVILLFALYFIASIGYSTSEIIEKINNFDGSFNIIRNDFSLKYGVDNQNVFDIQSIYSPRDINKYDLESYYLLSSGYGWDFNLMEIRINAYKNSSNKYHPYNMVLHFPNGEQKTFNIIKFTEIRKNQNIHFAQFDQWPENMLSRDYEALNFSYLSDEMIYKSSNGTKYYFSVAHGNDPNKLTAKITKIIDVNNNIIKFDYIIRTRGSDKNTEKYYLHKILINNIEKLIIDYEYKYYRNDSGKKIRTFNLIKNVKIDNKNWEYDYIIPKFSGEKRIVPFLTSIKNPDKSKTEFSYYYDYKTHINSSKIKSIISNNKNFDINYANEKGQIKSLTYCKNACGKENQFIEKKNYEYDISGPIACNKNTVIGDNLTCLKNSVASEDSSNNYIDKNIYTYINSNIDSNSPIWAQNLLTEQETFNIDKNGVNKLLRTIFLSWEKDKIFNVPYYSDSDKYDNEYYRPLLKQVKIIQDKTSFTTEYFAHSKSGCPEYYINKGVTSTLVKGRKKIDLLNNSKSCSYKNFIDFPIRKVAYDVKSDSLKKFTYDAIGRVITKNIIYNNQNLITTYNYLDNYGVEIIYPNKAFEKFFYQPFGSPDYKYLLEYTSLINVLTKTERDESGTVTKIDKDGYLKEFIYNNNNKLIEFKEPKIGFVKFEYDELNNTVQQTNSNEDILLNYFDLNRNLIKTHFNKEQESNYFDYDIKNRLIESKNNNGSWSYKYDENDNLIDETLFINGKIFSFNYFYDNTNTLIGFSYPFSNKKIMLSSIINNTKFDKNNRLYSFDYGNGIKLKKEYNAFDKISEIKFLTNLSTQNLKYDFDILGNIIEARGIYNYNYDYDDGNRLIKILNKDTHLIYNIGYNNFDLITNFNESSYIHNNHNRIIDYKYDNAGRVIYDNNHSYKYNSYGQLISKDSEKYFYDANGNKLLAKKCNDEILYIYNKKNQKILEVSKDRYIEYYYYDNILIAENNNGNLFYYHYDVFGNVIFKSNDNQDLFFNKMNLPQVKFDNKIINFNDYNDN